MQPVEEDHRKYLVRIAGEVRQTLFELPPEERSRVVDCLNSELADQVGDRTAVVGAWELESQPEWRLTPLSCGWWAAYRTLSPEELEELIERSEVQATIGYFVADMSEINPTAQ